MTCFARYTALTDIAYYVYCTEMTNLDVALIFLVLSFLLQYLHFFVGIFRGDLESSLHLRQCVVQMQIDTHV